VGIGDWGLGSIPIPNPQSPSPRFKYKNKKILKKIIKKFII
jgi:hypothetical protein